VQHALFWILRWFSLVVVYKSYSVLCDLMRSEEGTFSLSIFRHILQLFVLTCFAVKPRRQRVDDSDDEAERDQAVFRLCIYDNDTEKLLNPDNWPNSAMISPWYFKNPGTRETNNLPPAAGSADDAAAVACAVSARPAATRSNTPDTVQPAGAMAATTASSEAPQDESMMSNDETILTPINSDNDGN